MGPRPVLGYLVLGMVWGVSTHLLWGHGLGVAIKFVVNLVSVGVRPKQGVPLALGL
jgi:hypothetical protein